MTSQTPTGDIISDRYASALYELTSTSNSVDEVLGDLEFIQDCINESRDLKLLIKSPLINSTDKLNIIEKFLSSKKSNKLTSNFLKVISRNKRFPKISSIISGFKNINIKKRGDIIANVTSAETLSEDQKNGINKKLKSILGDKLSINFYIDKKIIGGLIVKVGSKMVDSSLVSKINKLKIAMKGAWWK